MSFIFKSTNISIKNKKNSFFLEVKNTDNNKNKYLFDSIDISNLDVKKKCSENNICSIEFQAESVLSLKKIISTNDYLDYKELVSLFESIKKQLDFLYIKKLGILYFTIDDIVVIEKNDKKQFVFLNSNKIFDVIDDKLFVTNTFEKNNKNVFLQPELLSYNSIPFNISHKSCYFSLSLLISFCIEGKKIDFLKPISWNVDDYIKILEPISNTSLYWALLRCQEFSPEDRYLLLI